MVLVGDALTRLRELPAEAAHCCVTSPPYWGLRDYGVDGQLGLEPTPEEFIAKMIEIFREVRRVLRADGTLWLNMGDGYAGGGRGGIGARSTLQGGQQNQNQSRAGTVGRGRRPGGLRSKDMIGMPWRLAFALQADGWILRQDIIWHKPNPMPESVRDRCTKAHEYLFLLAKQPRYYFNAEAIKEKCSPNTHARMARAKPEHAESSRAHGGGKSNGSMGPRLAGVNPKAQKVPSGWNSGPGRHDTIEGRYPRSKQNASFSAAVADLVDQRNKRSVWSVGSYPFKEAHFATFPPKLIEPCILAGSTGGGVILDPFFGAGTTGLVATRLGRSYIGIELNPTYAAMAEKRIQGAQLEILGTQRRG